MSTLTESAPCGALDTRGTLGRPALGVISFDEAGGGVAYIARLLREALSTTLARPPLLLTLDAERDDAVGRAEAIRFTAKVGMTAIARRADWFLFGHPGIARAVSAIPKSLRPPYAVQLHGTDAWERAPSDAVRGAALRIAPSRFTAAMATRAFPDIGPIAVCPHGILPERVVSSERADDSVIARLGTNGVAIVGRLSSSERYKGHDQLLECWPSVLAAVPDAQLVIVGEGDDRNRLEAKASEIGIGERVLFTGFVSHGTREEIFRRVKAFAMPSRGEGFGLVYLEAMRHALPCIGSTDDAAEESILDGHTGYLVAQRDVAALGRAVTQLLCDEQLCRGMGEAGRRRLHAEFTFERYRERLVHLLAEHFARRQEQRSRSN